MAMIPCGKGASFLALCVDESPREEVDDIDELCV